MKTNELMIGDWVDFYHPYEPEKNIVTRHRITETFECGLVGISDHNNPVHADHIEPIKLTTEILEKNWFIKENESWWYKDFRIVLDNSKGESLICGRQVKFTYVHQLQHALRLCGIEKEIEL